MTSDNRLLIDQIRKKAESSLEAFIRLVHPQRVIPAIHSEVISWLTSDKAKSHQLILLPRDHGKSALAAYYVAWMITKNPAIRVLYISSTSNLAEKQLYFIKGILTSPIYQKYWPDMVNKDENKREKWTNSEICVDHPLRKVEAIRDPTVFIAGLTTTITGMHCDLAVLDDVVVHETAYTEEGRDRVKTQYSLLASIEAAGAKEIAVGTRYHPRDLYADLLTQTVDIFDDEGELVESDNLYDVFERQVESTGDGTGEYLWPKEQRSDGKWFGFDQRILAKKRAQYQDKTQFRAQYYNDPNDVSSSPIKREFFQYYDRKLINRRDGRWYLGGNRINIFAAIDFAFSKRQKADSTAIVVIGVDSRNNYYVLEIDRFKSNSISEYFAHILSLHTKWDFRKIRCEVTSAQEVIVKDLKENYIRPYGLALAVDEHRPTRHDGRKQERLEAILQPKYANQQVWHYQGGNCSFLEEELTLQNPPHDDIKDALASAMEIAVAPTVDRMKEGNLRMQLNIHPVFGGITG